MNTQQETTSLYQNTPQETQINNLQRFQREIQPLRQQLIQHPVYHKVKSIENARIFMQHHVYAVWDFMSLLKALQRNLTCIDVPWVPVGSAKTRYLINEIVTGEESDIDEQGNRTSHYELYIKAMNQAGADTRVIENFIQDMQHGDSFEQCILKNSIPEQAQKFMQNTFEMIRTNEPHIIASVFTFGREDLIPDMFLEIIEELKNSFPSQLHIFHYYIQRHIDIDGDHHSHLAHEMASQCCGDDPIKWERATLAVKKSLQSRINLWNAISDAMY